MSTFIFFLSSPYSSPLLPCPSFFRFFSWFALIKRSRKSVFVWKFSHSKTTKLTENCDFLSRKPARKGNTAIDSVDIRRRSQRSELGIVWRNFQHWPQKSQWMSSGGNFLRITRMDRLWTSANTVQQRTWNRFTRCNVRNIWLIFKINKQFVCVFAT